MHWTYGRAIGIICATALVVLATKQTLFLVHESKRQQASFAAQRGDLVELGRLLDAGVSPNADVRTEPDSSWFWIVRQSVQHEDDGALGKPLIVTAAFSHPEEVSYLLRRGANPSEPDGGGGTALWIAARHNDIQTVNLLLAQGADPFANPKGGGPGWSDDANVQDLIDPARTAWVRQGRPHRFRRTNPAREPIGCNSGMPKGI